MATSLAAVITLVALGAWHIRNRRHPNWFICPVGRFYITAGYPAVVIAMYWLVSSSTIGGFEWALGGVWALGAVTAFVYGFNALGAAAECRTFSDLDIESTPAAEATVDIR